MASRQEASRRNLGPNLCSLYHLTQYKLLFTDKPNLDAFYYFLVCIYSNVILETHLYVTYLTLRKMAFDNLDRC